MRRTAFTLSIALALGAPFAAGQDCVVSLPAEGEQLTLAAPVAGSVTKEFGEQFNELLNTKEMHQGVDFEGPSGEPVYAALAGKVVEAGQNGLLGVFVRIDHGNGFATGYGHLSRSDVAVGACVTAGQEIGKVGSTGLSAAPHLFFQVIRDGTPVNPLDYLP